LIFPDIYSMKKIITLGFALLSFTLFAQLPPAVKLAAHYCFDDVKNLSGDCSDKGSKSQFSPIAPKQVCGINGGAIELKGSEFMFLYDASYKFSTANFAISFYFKPTTSIGVRDIFTNADSCKNKRALQIQYDASSRSIKVKMKDEKRSIDMSVKIDNGTCWQHIVFIREGNYHKLFLNGVRKTVAYTPDNQRINLTSNSVFTIGKSGCDPNVPGSHLRGLIDEFRLYDTAIKEEEAVALYDKPDRIKNQDVLLFIGDEVKVTTEKSCANKHSWFPTKFIDDPVEPNITIKPDKAGFYTYTARFSDTTSTCTSYDTIKVTVIDPLLQPCGEVYMPNAFTPNGDENNETFGISNPYTIGTLQQFEILDRWGGVVFYTQEPFTRWDGKFNGQLAQPGSYLYRIKYTCQGQEKSKTGSFVLVQ
jgi:gliding motility-associated-like protein